MCKNNHKEPLYLVTNLPVVEEACFLYRKRFRIETFFSDQKSRGFHLHKSHLSDPKRLARLMIASCLAYLWVVYLGAFALVANMHTLIKRRIQVAKDSATLDELYPFNVQAHLDD